MRFKSIVFTLFVFQVVTSLAQNSLEESIFKAIYNQNYQHAETLLRSNRTDIDSIHYCVFTLDLSYWKNVTGTETPNYQVFEHDLQSLYPNTVQSEKQQIIQLITLSYKLRYELKRYKLLKAISTRQKTKALFTSLKTNKELPPELQELYQLYSALFQYFDNYLKPFFVSEKKENCIEALATMTCLYQSENQITKTLVAYFLGKTWLKYEDDPKNAVAYFQWLHKNYPKNERFEAFIETCKKQLKE